MRVFDVRYSTVSKEHPPSGPFAAAPNIRGGARPSSAIAPQSRFRVPINYGDGEIHGSSRRWGDAPPAVQSAVKTMIIEQTAARGWPALQTAFALAVARFESGFNPDAAALRSSAAGVGQLVDQTASALGLNESERFSASAGIAAMLDLIEQNAVLASRISGHSPVSAAGLALQYALYHDGPSLKFGGIDIAKQSVLPWVGRFLKWIGDTRPTGSAADLQI